MNKPLGIVLTDGILTNVTLRYVRDFLIDNLHIFAVVSLPDETFRQAGVNPKTSVVFGVKKGDDEDTSASRTFMAELDKLGNDLVKKTVPVIFKRGENGEVIRDDSGRAQIDTEVPNLIEEFRAFKIAEGLRF